MRAGQALAAVELCAAVLLLMVAQGVVNFFFRAERIDNSADRAVGKRQLIAPAGKSAWMGAAAMFSREA